MLESAQSALARARREQSRREAEVTLRASELRQRVTLARRERDKARAERQRGLRELQATASALATGAVGAGVGSGPGGEDGDDRNSLASATESSASSSTAALDATGPVDAAAVAAVVRRLRRGTPDALSFAGTYFRVPAQMVEAGLLSGRDEEEEEEEEEEEDDGPSEREEKGELGAGSARKRPPLPPSSAVVAAATAVGRARRHGRRGRGGGRGLPEPWVGARLRSGAPDGAAYVLDLHALVEAARGRAEEARARLASVEGRCNSLHTVQNEVVRSFTETRGALVGRRDAFEQRQAALVTEVAELGGLLRESQHLGPAQQAALIARKGAAARGRERDACVRRLAESQLLHAQRLRDRRGELGDRFFAAQASGAADVERGFKAELAELATVLKREREVTRRLQEHLQLLQARGAEVSTKWTGAKSVLVRMKARLRRAWAAMDGRGSGGSSGASEEASELRGAVPRSPQERVAFLKAVCRTVPMTPALDRMLRKEFQRMSAAVE